MGKMFPVKNVALTLFALLAFTGMPQAMEEFPGTGLTQEDTVFPDASNRLDWRPAPRRWGRILDRLLAAHKLPSGAVLVQSPDWGVRFLSRGAADLYKNNDPITPEHQFRIGSVSKMFTAHVILQMVQEGRIKLSDPISKYLPSSLLPNMDDITLWHLLTMTSGLPDYTEWKDIAEPGPETATHNYLPADLIELARRGSINFEPGYSMPHPLDASKVAEEQRTISLWAYNNVGYVLLGLLIEELTGQTAADVIKERIFDRLGMTDTYMAMDENFSPRMAHSYAGYFFFGGWFDCTGYNPSSAWTSGAIITTPWDLLCFFKAVFTDNVLLDPYTRAQLFRMGSTELALSGAAYGVAMMQFVSPTGVMRGHGGTIQGYITTAFHYPDIDSWFIGYSTSSDDSHLRDQIQYDVMDQVTRCPNRPSPANGTDTPVDADGRAVLTWKDGFSSADRYVLWLGTDRDAVEFAESEGNGIVRFELVDNRFTTPPLQPGTTYWWRVDTIVDREDEDVDAERVLMLERHAEYELEYTDIYQSPAWSFTVQAAAQ
jgi:D-alanyl-D-alanine carboxypeptidase